MKQRLYFYWFLALCAPATLAQPVVITNGPTRAVPGLAAHFPSSSSASGDRQNVICDDYRIRTAFKVAPVPLNLLRPLCATQTNTDPFAELATTLFDLDDGKRVVDVPGVDPATPWVADGDNHGFFATERKPNTIVNYFDVSPYILGKPLTLPNIARSRIRTPVPKSIFDFYKEPNFFAQSEAKFEAWIADLTHRSLSPPGTIPVAMPGGFKPFNFDLYYNALAGHQLVALSSAVDANGTNLQASVQTFAVSSVASNQPPTFSPVNSALMLSTPFPYGPFGVASDPIGLTTAEVYGVFHPDGAVDLDVSVQDFSGAVISQVTLGPLAGVEQLVNGGGIYSFAPYTYVIVYLTQSLLTTLYSAHAVLFDVRQPSGTTPILIGQQAGSAQQPDQNSWQAIATAAGSGVSTLESSNAGLLFVGSAMNTTGLANVYEQPFIIPSTCVPTDTTLCLLRGRFALNVSYLTTDGRVGYGHVRPLTDTTGTFFFFDGSNIEGVVKMVDGCALNGKSWVFAAGLTNVRTLYSVTDTLTGFSQTYGNPQGAAFVPTEDTEAFDCKVPVFARPVTSEPDASVDRSGERGTSWFEWARSAVPSAAAGAGCVPNATTLCLDNSRFAVTTTFRTNSGQTGSGMAQALTSDTGFFWFFNSSDVEEVVKVLNGCSLDNNYWFFAGGLTNVQVTTTVTDTQTGHSKTYHNHQNTIFQPIQDTKALAVCP